uniref:Protein kinase domain-containing protein n=1 Tax=Lepisosteus oculatus TaxID=7918 RepID=W5NAJ9_LEPOC
KTYLFLGISSYLDILLTAASSVSFSSLPSIFIPDPYSTSEPDSPCSSLLLPLSLQFEAKTRISAEEALRHPYFRSLGEQVQTLPDTASIFSVKDIQLHRDPGKRSTGHPESGIQALRWFERTLKRSWTGTLWVQGLLVEVIEELDCSVHLCSKAVWETLG